MTLQVFLIMLIACSVFTTLTVEGIKKMFAGGKASKANILAAIVAVVLAIAVGFGYAAIFMIVVNAQYIIAIIGLCFLSWLCAMVGYDKVVQAVKQITEVKKQGADFDEIYK